MKNALLVLLAVSLVVFSMNRKVYAQHGTYSCSQFNQLWGQLLSRGGGFCGYIFESDALPLADPPDGLVCCNPFGVPGDEECIAPKPSCGAPPNVENKTCPFCPSAGSPISLATGNTYITESDIRIPGLGGGLALSRTWNSTLAPEQSSLPQMFGRNWRSTYEESLVFNSADGYLEYTRADGSVWTFAASVLGSQDTYALVAPANDPSTITDGSPNWTLTLRNGEKRLFDASSGRLVALADRNGNTTQLSYDSSNRLTTITDPASRHLYFSYSGPASTLVTTVTSDVGISLAYAYDPQGRLTQVTEPDGTTISFQFDSNSNITAVLDMNNKVLETHTYDVLNRGLTSSRANGVDAVTVTYP